MNSFASFTQSPGNQMQKIEVEVILIAQTFDHFSHYCSDIQAGSFIACLRQPVGQQEGVLGG